LEKLTVDELKKILHKRGLSTTGRKGKLITDYLLHNQKEAHLEWKQKERVEDPVEMHSWWRASIIVALFNKQARILHYNDDNTE